MTTSLAALAEEEERLLAEVRSGTGTMEATCAALEARGVLHAYAIVHRRYVELAEAGDLEGLKRAIFLQWFEVLEPPFLTGVENLDRDAAARAIALVEALCAADALDEELRWMLPYYFLLCDWAFPPAEQCASFTAYCREHAPRSLMPVPSSMLLDGRGQMGEYWREMKQSREKDQAPHRA